ncbi:hypothetical protein Tco_0503238 [Tanacetum coccineum]
MTQRLTLKLEAWLYRYATLHAIYNLDDKYENTTITDEMLDDMYNFAMMKEILIHGRISEGKAKLMVEYEKGKEKLMVSDEMTEHDKGKAKRVEHDKGKAKHAEHDLDDVDLVEALDLENGVKILEEDFSRLFFGDEDVLCFNNVKYPLTDAEIRLLKKTPTKFIGPRRQLASTSTRSELPLLPQHTELIEDNLIPPHLQKCIRE